MRSKKEVKNVVKAWKSTAIKFAKKTKVYRFKKTLKLIQDYYSLDNKMFLNFFITFE